MDLPIAVEYLANVKEPLNTIKDSLEERTEY